MHKSRLKPLIQTPHTVWCTHHKIPTHGYSVRGLCIQEFMILKKKILLVLLAKNILTDSPTRKKKNIEVVFLYA